MKRKSLNLIRGLTWLRYTLKMPYRMMGVNTTAGWRQQQQQQQMCRRRAATGQACGALLQNDDQKGLRQGMLDRDIVLAAAAVGRVAHLCGSV
jgi:hypothetical protein